MAQMRIRAPATALRGLRTGRIASLLVARRCYATEIEPERPKKPGRRPGNEERLGRTFQGQVMGSIGHRLHREREERDRYEHWRTLTDPSRNWTLSFCASRDISLNEVDGAALLTEEYSRRLMYQHLVLARNLLAA